MVSQKIKQTGFGFVAFPVILAIFLIFWGNSLRSVGYFVIPNIGIHDEFSYVWQGMSIRQTGVPVGWSDSKVYKVSESDQIKTKNIDGFTIKVNDNRPNWINFYNFPKPVFVTKEFDFGKGTLQTDLVMPFFDHPPFGGLILSLGVSSNSKTFLDLNSFQFRKATLPLAVLTSILLFLYIIQLTKQAWVGLIGVALYNTVPTYLLLSRFAFLENVLAMMVLLHLNLIMLVPKFQKRKKLGMLLIILSGLTGGLMVLTKESGLGFIVASLIMMSLWKLPRKYFFWFGMGFILPVFIYLAWGLWLDSSTFLQILIFNTSRQFRGSLNFLSILPSLRFEHFPLDGWWIWGFISIFYLSIKDSAKRLSLLIPFAGHLAIVLLLGSFNYPWYYLGLVPFLITGSAWLLWDFIYKTPKLIVLITFFLIPLSSSFFWGRSINQFVANIAEYRLLFLLFFSLVFLRLKWSENKNIKLIWSVFCFVLVLVLIKLNVDSFRYITINWGGSSLPSLPAL